MVLKKELFSGTTLQVIGAFFSSLGSFVTGTGIGWSGAVLADLQKEFVMGDTETSLIPMSYVIGGVVIYIVAGHLTDYYGRRKIFLIASPLPIAGWFITGFTNSILLMYFGRFLTGFGTIFISAPITYIGETCQPSIRGRLSSVAPLAMSLGYLASYTLGAVMHWRTTCFILAVPPAILIALMFFMPETPYWYMMKKREIEAENSLKRFRGPNVDVTKEFQEIASKLESLGDKVSYSEFLKPRSRRPLAIALFLQALQHFTGNIVYYTYTSNIFEAANLNIDKNVATVVSGVSQFAGSLLSILFIDRFGRKPLLLASMLGIFLFTIPLAFYFLALEYSIGEPWPPWMAVVCVSSLMFSYTLAARSVPFIAATELFNTKIRSRANTVCLVFNLICLTILLQIFPHAVKKFGYSPVFFSFSFSLLVFGIITAKILPETKGKSFEEIQEYFESFGSKEIIDHPHDDNKSSEDIEKDNCTEKYTTKF